MVLINKILLLRCKLEYNNIIIGSIYIKKIL